MATKKSIDKGQVVLQYYHEKLNNATSASAARKVLKQAMNDAQTVTFGITSKDKAFKTNQDTIIKLLQIYGNTYKTDVTNLISTWRNATNNKDIKSANKSTTNIFDNYFTNGYQPNNYNGQRLRETGDKVTVNGKSQNVWYTEGNGNKYVWIGDGNRGGKYITLDQYNKEYGPKPNPEPDYDTGSNGGNNYGAPANTNNTPAASSTSTSSIENDPIVKEPAANMIDWQKKDIDEMAAILGLETYKTADILKLYDEVTNKQYDQLDTDVKRAQAENLRALEGTYNDYLSSMRENRANAISNGMTKGAAAAQQLATMYANAQTIAESQQKYYDSQYDIAQERATSLAQNAINAKNDRLEIEKYLGELRGTYQANDVNELAARLAYSSQLQDAKMQADATTKAAGITADANRYAANVGAAASTAASNYSTSYFEDLVRRAQNGELTAQETLKYYQKLDTPITK